MSGIDFKDQDELESLICDEFSDWSEPTKVTQQMIDDFAVLSGDSMWMHVDAERCAKESPFGKTIAHGFLILSLIPKMPCGKSIPALVSGYRHMMNYGSDKLRFLNPVTVDSDIHARNRVSRVEVNEKRTKVTMEVQVQAVGEEKPALIYELAFVFM